MKIVFLDTATLGESCLDPIRRLGDLVCYLGSTPEEARQRVADADILIVNKLQVNQALLDAAPRLKLVCVAATGVNNIDLDACAKRGIPVKNVAGYSTDSVTQLVFTQMLSLLVKPERYDAEIKDGTYTSGTLFTDISTPFMELSGKTIGVIGMGTIGSKVASVATAFGMKVIYYSTSGTSHCRDYPSVALDELLRTSDVVSVHCPLLPSTNGLIGAEELALMKPSAIILNMARGGIVDEAALASALDNGVIAGAAVDVFTSEPAPMTNPLLCLKHPERIRLTPHVAWGSKEALARLVDGIANNIKSIL